MSPGQNTMTSGSGGMLLSIVIYHLSHWPLAAPDMNTCAAYAGLILIGVGYAIHRASLPKPPAQEPKP